MSYLRFARREADGHELDGHQHSRDARMTMESQTTLSTDEAGTEYRYQYEYEHASFLEIYSHPGGHNGHDWRLHPLNLTVGPELARQFHWKAETGTIYTYEHGLTSRYIHLDRITRQFCDQQRNPLSVERAMAHALPHPEESLPDRGLAIQALPTQTDSQQPLPSHTLVGQWKRTSSLTERGELSLGSFLRRVDFEAQQGHQRFTAAAAQFLQQGMPPGTSALVRIYRRLTMKFTQVPAQTTAPQITTPQLMAESAPAPRPVAHSGDLNLGAFTRRAA